MSQSAAIRTARFLWRFNHDHQDPTHEREILLTGGESPVGATLYAPSSWPRRRPAWILLHGITVPGRHHDALRKMARSLAASGHYAIAPEVPAWRALRVDPTVTGPTVRTAREALEATGFVDMERVGLLGFSVAARWALTLASESPGEFAAVAGMGGYWDIHRTLRAMVVGEHDWEGRAYRYRPDPYGRWIMGANLLPLINGGEFGGAGERTQAAASLRFLAETAGRNGAMAREPVYDTLNVSLRSELAQGARQAWDLLAPPSSRATGDREEARTLADQLASAAVERFPMLARTTGLDALRVPVVLLHGRSDRLIPFTETLRLAANLPPVALRRATITRLFGHTRSREARPPRNPVNRGRETAEFVGTISDLLASLET